MEIRLSDQSDQGAVSNRGPLSPRGVTSRQSIGQQGAQRTALEQLADVAARACGVVLWGVEYRAQARPPLLRVYIDHDDGVDVDQCARVSEQLSLMLDVESPIAGTYTLEVSSPGVERPFFFADQLPAWIGEPLAVRLAWTDRGRRKLRGRLVAVDLDEGAIELDDAGADAGGGEAGSGVRRVALSSVAEIRLVVDSWQDVLRRPRARRGAAEPDEDA